MFCQGMESVFLVVWHPYVDPPRIQVTGSGGVKQSTVRIRSEIKGTPRVVVAKVYAKVAAVWVASLPVEEIVVSVEIEVPERCCDIIVP